MEFITTFKTELIAFMPQIWRVVVTDAIALAAVYLLGRMLGFIEKPRIKNLIAFIVIAGVSYFYSWNNRSFDNHIALAFDAISYAAFSIILYVLVAFRLYDRWNALLDTKIGKAKKK